MRLSSLALVLLVIACSADAAPRVAPAKIPSPDIPIVEYVVTEAPYSVDSTGKRDATTAVQRIIDAANAKGGGVIFFPAGRYRFNGHLRLKQGVTLRGEWKSPAVTNGRVVGTVFAIYGNRGQEKADPFILMEKVSCLTNLSFWYPEQNPRRIVPYPWTIDATDPSSCGYAVRNVNFVNSYKALSNGADTGTCHNVAYYSNLYGCPLKEGLWVEWVLDITRVDRVFFGSRYWQNSGLPHSPKTRGEVTALRGFMYSNATAITSRRFDWFPLYVADIEGYGVGVKVTAGSQGAANGEMYGVKIRNGRIGLLLEAAQPYGWTITNCDIRALDKPDACAVLAKASLSMAPFQFNSCNLGEVVVEPKSGCALSFENCVFSGDVSAESGDVSILNSRFAPGRQARFSGVVGDVMIDNAVPHTADGVTVRVVKSAPSAALEYNPHPFAPLRHPASRKVFDIRTFGARGDGTTDDTEAFRKALAAAAKAGGTVYVSAGKYPVREPLTVPTGVELRGIFEGPTHTMVPGSVIFVETGDGDENGPAFLSLSPNSGVRGLNFWYPRQNIDKPIPYPWLIRALGKNCYVRDCALGQPWQAIDFASAADTSGHSIAGVGAAALRRGVFVDNAPKGGTVEGVQLVVHYWDRNDSGLPTTGSPVNSSMPDVNALMKNQTENFRFGDCIGERIFSTFGYSSRVGLALCKEFTGVVHQHGSDGTTNGVMICDNAKATLVNTLVAPVTPMVLYSNAKLLNPANLPSAKVPQIAITTDDGFTGDVHFVNTATWGYGESLQLNGNGTMRFNQITTTLAESGIANPNARICSAYGGFGHLLRWTNDASPDPSTGFGLVESATNSPEGAVLTFGAKATSSTRANDGQGPQCAVDGAAASLFASANTPSPTWIEIDLHDVHDVTGVQIMHEGRSGVSRLNTRDFVVSGRGDTTEPWQTIDTAKDNTDFITTHRTNGRFRFIRIDVTKANSTDEDNHTRIKEIVVLGR